MQGEGEGLRRMRKQAAVSEAAEWNGSHRCTPSKSISPACRSLDIPQPVFSAIVPVKM